MIDLIAHAKAGAFRPVEARDVVQVDREPHFAGVVMAIWGDHLVVNGAAGLFRAGMDEISIVFRAEDWDRAQQALQIWMEKIHG